MAEKKAEKSDVTKREEAMLAFWNEHDIFKKSEEKKASQGEFTFYDGPPFATGLPHYGHILTGTIKDAIPRYKTMRGYRVVRKWGWDCHGLPLENQIEEELGLKDKKAIEGIGIDVFNKAARDSVLRYVDDWKEIIPRMGRWVDMESGYKTMDAAYTESVWWVFKTLFDKGLIYEGFKSMHLCPRCGTTLSNFEVAQGYKDITDLAVTVKLELEGEPGTYLLVWTTTPWTLPGNMAAAVHKDSVYVKIRIKNPESRIKNHYILAKKRLEIIKNEYEVLEEFKGEKLIGKKYKPPFDYFVDKDIEGKENAWKICHAPYISTEEGTGAVHVAPAFGAEDMELAKKYNIPLVHHVGTDGTFSKEVVDFAGISVKPKGDHQSADIEIIKNLAHRNLLFKKEKIVHTYPHCWRCETPLLNYAASSWFVKVVDIKGQLVAQNKKVHWIPENIGGGRFGKWLEGAPDWAISRSRYWGAPLPVWRNKDSGSMEIIGSVEELKEKIQTSGNTYFIMRHGEADNNANNIVNADNTVPSHLTDKGKEDVKRTARGLKRAMIDMVFVSPLKRTRETADIVREELKLREEQIIVDDRLKEIQTGEFNGKNIEEYRSFFSSLEEKMVKRPKEGENLMDMKRRIGDFLYDIEKAHSSKNILIITHEYGVWMADAVARGLTQKQTTELRGSREDYANTSEVCKLSFVPLPHNGEYELDLHRPYIDKVVCVDKKGSILTRIPEVFDCWFESGSMPYGQFHYPFENTDIFEPKKERGFPADFIAEGMDQTRGWFYSLIVLGVALFGKSPYKHVIVSGTILAEDGQKMSKRLKNYPDPMDVVHHYGADALRYYLLSSSVMKGEDLYFSEKGVAEVMRKNIVRLSNVLSFYELYADSSIKLSSKSNNRLDQWIVARLRELIKEVTNGMELYELDRATRPIADFIDDLSTWYVRRSRGRFKGDSEDDKKNALATTRYVLLELSKVMAPFMPFFAEYLYQRVKVEEGDESVHLTEWPREGKIDTDLIKDMTKARSLVTLVLEARDNAQIKVRQPLSELKIKNKELQSKKEILQLIRDEINVKTISFDETLEENVVLDTEITPELKEEGYIRELIRHIQVLRKKKGLTPKDFVKLTIGTDDTFKQLVIKYKIYIEKTALLSGITFGKVRGEYILVAGSEVSLAINR